MTHAVTIRSVQVDSPRHLIRRNHGLCPPLWLSVVLVLGISFPQTTVAEAATIVPSRFVTPNGLTVLTLEQDALPIVQIHAMVKAGSAHDSSERAGLAHLTAIMLDEGTKTRSANQIAEAIDFVGGELRTDVTEDFTTLSAKVLQKDTHLGFDLLSDILLRPTFAEEELTRVRSITLGEIQSEEEDPELIAMKAFHQVVFKGHPYRWPVNGTRDTVSRITRDDVRAFYAHRYLPSETILVVVGNITVDETRSLVTKYLGSWTARERAAPSFPSPALIHKPIARLIDKDLTQSTIVLGHEGISRNHQDYYAVSVMNYILGAGGFSSRLMDSIRDRQGLAYGVGSTFEANLMPGAFVVSLQTRNEATNKAIDAVLSEIKGMQDEEVSAQELSDAKAYLVGSFALRLDTISKLARTLALVEFYGLGLEYFSHYPKWIEQVTGADVLKAARTYLHPDRYVLVVVGDLSKANVNVDFGQDTGAQND